MSHDLPSKKDEKIILPGGAGLVGQNLVARLKESGYTNLAVIDKHQANLTILQKMHPEIKTCCADLATAGHWETHFETARAVIMLQAQIGDLREEPFIRNNITATQNILEVMQKNKVPYLVHISSSVVNSVADDFYTQTKKNQEQIVLDSGIRTIVLRPTLMFGWFDRKHLGWLSRFMKKVPLFPIPGNGRYMRQPLYVGDFCRIIQRCLEQELTGVYNISGLERIDYIDMIRLIRNTVQAKTWICSIPYALFDALLRIWAFFDKNPPFTRDQLKALVAGDEFEEVDWPRIFKVQPTPFQEAIGETFQHPIYGSVILEF